MLIAIRLNRLANAGMQPEKREYGATHSLLLTTIDRAFNVNLEEATCRRKDRYRGRKCFLCWSTAPGLGLARMPGRSCATSRYSMRVHPEWLKQIRDPAMYALSLDLAHFGIFDKPGQPEERPYRPGHGAPSLPGAETSRLAVISLRQLCIGVRAGAIGATTEPV